jgi:hypothetical protein
MDTKFINAVQIKNIVRVRLALSNELMLDPRGKTFKEMLQYAESNLPLLYQDDDGKIYDNDSAKWNENFLYDLKNDLDLNFSKEKLSLYEIVAKHVLKDKADKLEKEEVFKNKTVTRKSFVNNKKFVYSGITITGAVLAIASLCMNKKELAMMLKDYDIDKRALDSILPIVGSFGLLSFLCGGYLLYKSFKK